MRNAGLGVMFETARFWASRVTYDKRSKKFGIKRVIGPDEFHEGVDNNAYTNKMAQWNLYKAKIFYEDFGKAYPRYLRKINKKLSLTEREVSTWVGIADKIKIPFSESKGIIEEYDGYLRKKNIV